VTAAAPEIRRPPGRPRSAEADEAILDAAIELFADAGYEGFTVEAVAARAGVGKATVYRRYPGKLDLVVAACRARADVGRAAPDTGSTRGDLDAIVEGLIGTLTSTPLGRAVPMLVAEAARVPELDAQHQVIVAEKRSRTRVVVDRAIERGDVRADVDPDLVIDACVGPIFYRFLVTRAPLDAGFASAHVESVLRAFAP
jgi:AcrR family transcriptional regulator